MGELMRVFNDADVLRVEHRLLSTIPLVAHMSLHGISLQEEGLSLSAPLAPNVNDKGTGFGGALSAIATLSGWSLTSIYAESIKANGFDVVVHTSELTYLAPVKADFCALCFYPEEPLLEVFLHKLAERGKASLPLRAEIRSNGEVAVMLSGRFVAFARAEQV